MLDIMALCFHVDLFNPFLSPKGSLYNSEHASNIGDVLNNRNNFLDLSAVLIEEFVDLLDKVKLVIVSDDALEVLKLYGFVLYLMQVLGSYVVLLHLWGKGLEIELKFWPIRWWEGKSIEFLSEFLLVVLNGALHFEF